MIIQGLYLNDVIVLLQIPSYRKTSSSDYLVC